MNRPEDFLVTRPKTLEGPETAAEHIRNAIQILRTGLVNHVTHDGWYVDQLGVDAACDRLLLALQQLEGK